MSGAFWKNLLIGAFLLGFIGLLGSFNAARPRILVLQSADQTSPWVRDVDVGIRQALKDNRRPVTVQWRYMDLNHKPHADQQNDAAVEAHRAIAQIDPDIMIAVDDESNALVARYYAGRERPKVVFVSIDQPPEQYGYVGAANVSGIAELMPLAAVRDALLAMEPGQARRIAALGVNHATGQAELAQVQTFDWTPHRLTMAETTGNFADWQSAVQRAASQADVLLVLSYRGLERGGGDHQITPGAEIANWIETHAALLPVGVHASYVEDGGGLSFSPSAVDFGQKAIQLALTWLDDPATAPPVTASAHFHVALRPARLAARQVELPAIYVEAARIGGTWFP